MSVQYTCYYPSPLGTILLASDGQALTGAWFEGQRYYARTLEQDHILQKLPVFDRASAWLDVYFSGKQPDFTVPSDPYGTAFQQAVWQQLRHIPYGQTVTYGELALRLGSSSPRAVGNAVGRNPISLFLPCHRVVGANGSLTGYAGGLNRKQALLAMEQHIR